MAEIDHVAAIVKDLDGASKFLIDFFGFRLETTYENSKFGIKVAMLSGENFKVELIQPVAEGRCWESMQNGMLGLDHIALSVEDVESSIKRLNDVGVKNEEPFEHTSGTLVNLDPTTTNGIRIQLIKKRK